MKLKMIYKRILDEAFFLLFVTAIMLESGADGYCKGIGINPGFIDGPTVHQISPTKVNVSWKGIVTRKECSDKFLVKYWPVNSPDENNFTTPLENDADYDIINVVPKVPYMFQVIARELKGIWGTDNNESKPTKFRTKAAGNIYQSVVFSCNYAHNEV